MLIFLWFILASFASHRIALMVTKEDGPAWIFRKLRRLPPPKSSAREGLSCIWCGAVWSAAITTGLLHDTLALKWSELTVFWLATSSGAIAINQVFTKG